MIAKVLLLSWLAIVVDFDPSINKSVALVEGKDSAGTTYAVALESTSSFPFKEGQVFVAEIEISCESHFGIDEKMSNMFNTWIKYEKMICNSAKIKYVGEK